MIDFRILKIQPSDNMLEQGGRLLQRMENNLSTCIPIFIAALITITKIQKLPKCPSRNKDVVHIYNRIPVSHKKKNKIMPFTATWMQLEITK